MKMSTVSPGDIHHLIKQELTVDGPVAELGIHYDAEPATQISENMAVSAKLNEKSLAEAEKKTGVTRTPTKDDKAKNPSGPNAKSGIGSALDGQMFGRPRNRASLEASFDLQQNTKHRPTSGGSFGMSSPNLPMGSRQRRRLLQLRRTFDQIAAQKKKVINVKAESLPQPSIQKMVKAALDKGDTKTAVGSIERSMQLAGMDPEKKPKNGLQKAFNRWEHALMPGSYVSGPTMRSSS